MIHLSLMTDLFLPEVEGSGALNCVTERIRNVAIKNVASKTRLFLLVERTELRRPSAAGQGEVAPRGTLMRKTGSRQSRRWIRTRRARDHMQARAKLIQRAPRGSPQHLSLTRWPGGLLSFTISVRHPHPNRRQRHHQGTRGLRAHARRRCSGFC